MYAYHCIPTYSENYSANLNNTKRFVQIKLLSVKSFKNLEQLFEKYIGL